MGWTEIQSATMEIDRSLEMLDVAEAPRGFLDPLDRRIDGFHSRIGDAMTEVSQHVGTMALAQESRVWDLLT